MSNHDELYLKHDMDLPVSGSFEDSFQDSFSKQGELEPALS
jgi:hypothetical protein